MVHATSQSMQGIPVRPDRLIQCRQDAECQHICRAHNCLDIVVVGGKCIFRIFKGLFWCAVSSQYCSSTTSTSGKQGPYHILLHAQNHTGGRFAWMMAICLFLVGSFRPLTLNTADGRLRYRCNPCPDMHPGCISQ